MANPTTNYSFAMPTNTDLVKDLPADFDIFGQAVDDRIKALNPSTTLGDIEYRSSTANTNTRLGIGTTGQVLTVAGGVPSWATPAVPTSGLTFISRTTFTNAATTNVDSLFSDTYENYIVRLSYEMANNGSQLRLRGRYATTNHSANYYLAAPGLNAGGNPQNMNNSNAAQFTFMDSSSGTNVLQFDVIRPGSSANLFLNGFQWTQNLEANYAFGGWIASNQAWSGLSIFANTGNVSGILSVYGLAKA
jgi:hypothetical protein